MRRAVARPGRSLGPELRAHLEQRLSVGLGEVRLHTDADASASARALGARAYTYGSDIMFSQGSYDPTSAVGWELIAHEVAHVAQQTATGAPMLAASPDGGFWDVVDVVAGPLVGEVGRRSGVSGADVGRYVLGDTIWDVLQAFGRGFMKGVESTSKEQRKRISDKFDDFGYADAYVFTEGYSLGVLKGMWYELTDLFEAIKTLIELPATINEFLIHKLPELATRLARAIAAPGGLGDQLKRLSSAFKKDPGALMTQVAKLLDSARTAILAEIEKRGQGVGRRAVDFLDEPWEQIGDDVGMITGRVLFEVLLAVGTDAIGNLVKEAAVVAGRIVEGTVEAVRGLGGLLRTLLEWLEGLVKGVAGAAGELSDALREFVASLRKLVGELGQMEAVGAEGVRVRVPAAEAGKGSVMEARALDRPPGSPTVEDLYGRPPKTEPKPKPKAPSRAKPPSAPRVKLLSMGEERASGAQWFLRDASAAEVEASQKGYQVYEYYNQEGRCLYVGRSGGAAEAKATKATEKALEKALEAPKKATNWVDRGWSHIQEERREIAEADHIVVHAELTEMEASALEHDRIAELKPRLNVKKGEFGSRSALGPNYSANVQSAQRQPTYRFETEIVPPTK